jgi:hypothetical protein
VGIRYGKDRMYAAATTSKAISIAIPIPTTISNRPGSCPKTSYLSAYGFQPAFADGILETDSAKPIEQAFLQGHGLMDSRKISRESRAFHGLMWRRDP